MRSLAKNRRHDNMPTLQTLEFAYGEGSARMWLIPRFSVLSEFCGCKDKMDYQQLSMLSDIVVSKYFYFNIGEIDDFIIRFVSGDYGVFYGVVDAMKITSALSEYRKVRSEEISKYEQEQERKALDEHQKTAISAKEFCRRKGFPEMDMPELIKHLMSESSDEGNKQQRP